MVSAPGFAADLFARQGFTVFPRFLAMAQVAPLRGACDRVLERQRASTDGSDTTNIAYLTNGRWHPDGDADRITLLEFIASPRITMVITAAIGPPLFHNTQYFMEPRTRSWTGAWHRDCQFLVTTQAQEDALRSQCRGVHFRVALVDDDHLEYVSGSEQRADSAKERAVRWPRGPKATDVEFPEAVRLPLRAGDALLFHAWGIHRGRYVTTRPRRTLDLIYNIGTPPPGCPRDAVAEPVPLTGLSPTAHAFFSVFNAERNAYGL
ncbi:MAG TPA: phytanoyl-CoA dioxygenase family protein [Planctomycetota bacterium]|nr:phytanoyl-CoA dioxygenase family protein [Planctomycetota bacterium]